MLMPNIWRIIFSVCVVIILVAAILISKLALKDFEGKRQRFKRITCYVISGFISVYLAIFGIMQVQSLVTLFPKLATFIYSVSIGLPIALITGAILGFMLTKIKYEKRLLLNIDTENRRLLQFPIEYLKGHAGDIEKPNNKELLNDDFTIIKYDKLPVIPWESQLGDDWYDLLLIEGFYYNGNELLVKTMPDEMLLMTKDLLNSKDEDDLQEKITIIGMYTKLEEKFTELRKENTLLRGLQVKSIDEETARRVASYLNLYKEGYCIDVKKEEPKEGALQV